MSFLTSMIDAGPIFLDYEQACVVRNALYMYKSQQSTTESIYPITCDLINRVENIVDTFETAKRVEQAALIQSAIEAAQVDSKGIVQFKTEAQKEILESLPKMSATEWLKLSKQK